MKLSFRCIFLVVAVACMAFALVGRWHLAAVAQRASVDKLRHLGHSVIYSHELDWDGDDFVFPDPATTLFIGNQNPGGIQGLILRTLGPDYASDVSVIFFSNEPPANVFELTASFKDVRYVWNVRSLDNNAWLQRHPKAVFIDK